MSDFGSSGPAAAMVIGALLLVPWLGWWPFLVIFGIGALLAYLLHDVNRRFNPDGTRRRRPRDGSGKRIG